MIRNPRILIGTLYSGENELDECKQSLSTQTYRHWNQQIIAHRPNKEAHDTLYQKFMSARDQYELFLKLDADMVFIDSKGLQRIVDLFTSSDLLDHAEIAVHDWFSNQLILGLHVFSSKCHWVVNNENLFVDEDPISPTPKQTFYRFPAPLAYHCPNPSPFQSFHFGIHRALKAIQLDRAPFNWFQFQFQWKLLKSIWKNFLSAEDRRLGIVILGADLVFNGELDSAHYDYTNPFLKNLFTKYEHLMPSDLHKILDFNWQRPFYAKHIAIKQLKQNPLGFLDFFIRQTVNIINGKQ